MLTGVRSIRGRSLRGARRLDLLPVRQKQQARQESQQNSAPVPFHKFVDMIRTQLGTLKEKGGEEVAFRVALKDGKVAFTARAIRGKLKSEE